MLKMGLVERANVSTSLFPNARLQKEEWEGCFIGETGSLIGFSFNLLASLHFFESAVEGEGRGLSFPTGEDRITLSGVTIGNSTEFDVWLHATGVDNKPMICIGKLDLKLGKIDGDFTVDCLASSSCGCGGGGGHFQMRRHTTVED